MKDVPDTLKKYKIPNEEGIIPDEFVLPNRKDFINWFDDMFQDYRATDKTNLKKTQKFQFFNHQKLIRDYMGRDSPYRGVLLYHGLGVGKTCGSISIAESFRSNRKIIILLNKSLKQNYIENLMKCGAQMFRLNQYWEFVPIVDKKKNKDEASLAKLLGIPSKIVKENKGAWLINFEKDEPNYSNLNNTKQQEITKQITEMIKKRYVFYHMDGLRKTKIESMIENKEFDNSVLVIDEVHNLTNSISKDNMGVRAKGLLNLIMNAENLKLVFLSGTPIINTAFELGILFNLLRGKIIQYNILCKSNGHSKSNGRSKLNLDKLAEKIRKHPFVSTVEIHKKNKTIMVTKNPYGFVNTDKGITRSPLNNIDKQEMTTLLREMVVNENVVPSIKIEEFTAFPDNREEFNKFFIGENQKGMYVKNIELFKSRIIGLVSHYKTTNKDLIPEKRDVKVLKIPMSDYQFEKYARVRLDEIENDKNRNKNKKKKKDKEEETIKSSYRAYSRIHCSFVFPESIERPFPSEIALNIIEGEESMFDDTADEEITETDKKELNKQRKKKAEKEYVRARNHALKELEKQGNDFLIRDDEDKLMKFSPKYNELLNNVELTDGTCFIYTEYKSLEGIAVLSVVLKANGYGQLKIIKDDKNNIRLKVEPENAQGPNFAVWEGSDENSDILRKIYNNDIDDLPEKIKNDFDKLGGTNLHGEVVKLLMTTKTGAEGIDLKNVRQVHIIEPYWNPVRLEQVIGRAIRVGSHLQLPQEERNVDIFTYITTTTKKQKKTNIVIEHDSGGLCSDEVLYKMSNNKLFVMNKMLRGVKESSVDCSLHISETQDMEDPFRCINVQSSSQLKLDELNYVPDINKDVLDAQKERRVSVTTWKPVFVKIKKKEYAMRKKDDGPDILYDAIKTRQGRPGEPIGEIKIVDNKKKVIFFAKKN